MPDTKKIEAFFHMLAYTWLLSRFLTAVKGSLKRKSLNKVKLGTSLQQAKNVSIISPIEWVPNKADLGQCYTTV